MANYLDEKNDVSANTTALRGLSSKVLYALSQSHFGAVFNRITSRLQELNSTSPDENSSEYNDIDLIQHLDLDVHRLNRLLQGLLFILFYSCFIFTPFSIVSTEINIKFKMIKKPGQFILINAVERAVWNWIEYHPHEFADLQATQNDDLSQ